jgi:hypothetical protein
VRGRFKAKYGDRVAWTTTPSLDRRNPGGVEAAVVDLWLLRRTHAVVGSTGSSFSELAVMHRDVEIVYCGGPTAPYARLERVVRAAGVEPLLPRLPFAWRVGTRPSLAALWWFYRSLPGAFVRRLPRWRRRPLP